MVSNILKHKSFYRDTYRQLHYPALNLFSHSLRTDRMGFMIKRSILKPGDPIFLRRALVNNLGEEKKTRIHIEKLQKSLIIRFKDIEQEKLALRRFMIQLHQTTGYFPRMSFW
ncbi:uncharacterized protein LOC144370062 [Ictidomys tridecemlineatus]